MPTKLASGLSLRKWQSECLTSLSNKINSGRKHFTVVATMGSGKTFLQGAFARYLLEEGFVDQVISLVPSDNLRTNCAEQFIEHFNLELSTTKPSKGVGKHGVITTYHMLSFENNVQSLLEETVGKGKRVLLLADEVHHGAADETKRWGNGLETLVDKATFSLMLSGTMWRTDGNLIAGVRYLQIGDSSFVVSPDYTYSLADATHDGVVSKVYFNEISARAHVADQSVKDDKDGMVVEFNRSKESRASEKMYRHLINPKGKFCAHLLTEADDALMSMTASQVARYPSSLPPAGLVVTPNCNAADEVAERLTELTGAVPVVVHSGIKDSKQLIKKFADGDLENRWMISVGMVSEGTDIPRIKVLVYLTTAKTELVFHQIIGRTMRVRRSPDGKLIDEDAMVFIPSTPVLHRHVSGFVKEQSRTAVLVDTKPKKKRRKPIKKVENTIRLIEATPVGGVETFFNGVKVAYEKLLRSIEANVQQTLQLANTTVGYPASIE